MRVGFDSLFGNGEAKRRLIDAITSGSFPHALMIVGDSGSGKKTLAAEIAMALNCEKKNDPSQHLPCRSCNSCRRIENNNYPDIKRLVRSSGKATVGVDEVRIFKEDMYLSATESSYKIYIFEDADAMTQQAQNALLISLEEPPQNVISILLVCESDKILTTIKSRVQHVRMQRFTPHEIADYLLSCEPQASKMNAENQAKFKDIVMSADGIIGRAKQLLDADEAAECERERETVKRVIAAFSAKSKHIDLYTALTELPKSRTELKPIFEKMLLAVRDLSSLKHDQGCVLLFFSDMDEARDLSGRFTLKRLLSIYDVISEAYLDTERNANITAMLTSLIAKIRNI